jgi:hypothetical protein
MVSLVRWPDYQHGRIEIVNQVAGTAANGSSGTSICRFGIEQNFTALDGKSNFAVDQFHRPIKA